MSTLVLMQADKIKSKYFSVTIPITLPVIYSSKNLNEGFTLCIFRT
jgi:hypothetical protein